MGLQEFIPVGWGVNKAYVVFLAHLCLGMVGSYASLSVCPRLDQNSLDQKSRGLFISGNPSIRSNDPLHPWQYWRIIINCQLQFWSEINTSCHWQVCSFNVKLHSLYIATGIMLLFLYITCSKCPQWGFHACQYGKVQFAY